MSKSIKTQFPWTLAKCLKALGVPSRYAPFYKDFCPDPDRPAEDGGYDRWKEQPVTEQLASVTADDDGKPHIGQPNEFAVFTGSLTLCKAWAAQLLACWNELPARREIKAFTGNLASYVNYPSFRKPTEEEMEKARESPPKRLGHEPVKIQESLLLSVPKGRKP